MKKCFLLLFVIVGIGVNLNANPDNPVTWSYSVNPVEGNKAELVFSATIAPGHQLYATEIPEGGPLPTGFFYTESEAFKKIGKIREVPEPKIKHDDIFGMDIGVHTKSVKFVQVIEILSETDFSIIGTMDYMVCTADMCMPFSDIDFKFTVKGCPQTYTHLASGEVADNAETSSENIWWFVFLALGAGLAAVLTPCVFPMIPITVSFFMSGGAKRSEGVLKGLIFGFSVALIYSLLGVVVAITKSADFANVLSTHWIANLIFFALFVLFACSFFGLFEIMLPTGLSNKLDAKADKGGLIASFFMAAVLTLVSFSCTGPF
ncbi:MAG: disulfide bond formation protein DsbD, partial [Prevotellaceae bacterium]|nr:disulfide bond formation protein DsbD [Prevotellaceae bacterium]